MIGKMKCKQMTTVKSEMGARDTEADLGEWSLLEEDMLSLLDRQTDRQHGGGL